MCNSFDSLQKAAATISAQQTKMTEENKTPSEADRDIERVDWLNEQALTMCHPLEPQGERSRLGNAD